MCLAHPTCPALVERDAGIMQLRFTHGATARVASQKGITHHTRSRTSTHMAAGVPGRLQTTNYEGPDMIVSSQRLRCPRAIHTHPYKDHTHAAKYIVPATGHACEQPQMRLALGRQLRRITRIATVNSDWPCAGKAHERWVPPTYSSKPLPPNTQESATRLSHTRQRARACEYSDPCVLDQPPMRPSPRCAYPIMGSCDCGVMLCGQRHGARQRATRCARRSRAQTLAPAWRDARMRRKRRRGRRMRRRSRGASWGR